MLEPLPPMFETPNSCDHKSTHLYKHLKDAISLPDLLLPFIFAVFLNIPDQQRHLNKIRGRAIAFLHKGVGHTAKVDQSNLHQLPSNYPLNLLSFGSNSIGLLISQMDRGAIPVADNIEAVRSRFFAEPTPPTFCCQVLTLWRTDQQISTRNPSTAQYSSWLCL